jgi:hypothetical protein
MVPFFTGFLPGMKSCNFGFAGNRIVRRQHDKSSVFLWRRHAIAESGAAVSINTVFAPPR